MLLIGLMPAYISLFWSHQGDCSTLTSVTTLATYLLQFSGFLISTDTKSLASFSPASSSSTSGYEKGLSKVAAASLAIPTIARQSGLLGVISKSTTACFRPSASAKSIPSSYSSSRIQIPSLCATGTTLSSNPSSSAEQSIPKDSTPLSLPLVIFVPPSSLALPWRGPGILLLWRATGT